MAIHHHTYDDNGLCFECDKPQPSKAGMMARLRKERAAAGLVELRVWLTPEQRDKVAKYAEKVKAAR